MILVSYWLKRAHSLARSRESPILANTEEFIPGLVCGSDDDDDEERERRAKGW